MTQSPFRQSTEIPGLSPVPTLLKLEAVVVLLFACAAYDYFGFSWWLFGALILAPDLALLGYFGGSKLGAWTYDVAHTYVVPALLGLVGYLVGQPMLLALAAIWIAHIGVDRLVGYGLKYPGDPKDNHLSRQSWRQ